MAHRGSHCVGNPVGRFIRSSHRDHEGHGGDAWLATDEHRCTRIKAGEATDFAGGDLAGRSAGTGGATALSGAVRVSGFTARRPC
jgi:hypothetical protein